METGASAEIEFFVFFELYSSKVRKVGENLQRKSIYMGREGGYLGKCNVC